MQQKQVVWLLCQALKNWTGPTWAWQYILLGLKEKYMYTFTPYQLWQRTQDILPAIILWPVLCLGWPGQYITPRAWTLSIVLCLITCPGLGNISWPISSSWRCSLAPPKALLWSPLPPLPTPYFHFLGNKLKIVSEPNKTLMFCSSPEIKRGLLHGKLHFVKVEG